ncbi:MFS transporter [Phormidium sp. CLA17]|uniref:MFS transporter n=1 Tax=Leptolyngbya sp. Cla-17 TaxID=2803751 RepID=UPI0014919C4E|nr:MFS transporter [Leptolyngbya sp. Cla-17]MBM0740500.1 MFS transporter [Leptolyngbya sp. Cla-17]
MKVFQTLQPKQRRNLVFLFASGLLFWASLASLLPTLSPYIKQAGATDREVGVVMGAFAIGLLIFRPWLGRRVDQKSRTEVLMIGLVAVAIAPLGYLMTQSIPILFAIRAFHGLSIAAFTTAFSALVTDLAPPQNRGEVLGYMTLVNPIGMALGPAIGGFLQVWAGYTPLFVFSAGLGFAGILCAIHIKAPPIELASSAASQKAHDIPFWKFLWNPRLRIPALVLTLIGISFGTLAVFVPLYIQETGVNLNAGLFYTAAAIASFGVRLLTGRASDRYGRGRFITISLLLYAVSMVLLWQAHSAPEFLLAGFLEGAGGGIFIPMIVVLTADRSQPHERGRVFGLCLAGFDCGMAIAGPVMGYFAEMIGYRGLFGLAAGIASLAVISFVTLCSKDLAHSIGYAFGRGRDIYASPQAGELRSEA